MEPLSAQTLPVVSHFILSIFNVSIPNLVVVLIFIAIMIVGAIARLPGFIEHGREPRKGR